jgi:hypothetical protein
MAKATAEHDTINADIAAAGTDHVRLTELSNRLAEVQATLADAESRWLDLAAEAEAAGLSFD